MAIDQNINKIKFLRSKTAGLVPSPSLFDEGELAINLVDRTIFSKNGTAVVELGFGKGGNVNGAISATGNITAPTFIGKLQGNANTASKWETSRILTLAEDVSGNVTFDGSTNFTLNAAVHTVYPRQNVMNFDEAPGNMRRGLSIDWVGNTSGFPNYGTVITAKAYAAGGSTFQIYSPYSPSLGGDSLRYRTGIYSAVVSWSELKTIVDNNNIGRYAPSLTGVGASGNWNIDVEGYATKLKTPVTINGTSFDGTSGIVIADPTFTRPLSHGSTIVTNTTDIASTGGVAFRFASTSTSSKPAGVTDGPILSMAYSAAWNFQLMGDHRTGVMYTRPKNNGTWGSWKTTLNNENIGDHALPITGGTLNGNLIVNGDVRSTGVIGSDSTKGFGTGNNRSIKPVDLTARTFAVNFVSLKGLNDPTVDAIYGDFISFNTWSGSSGGKLNGLFLTKGAQRIKHYQAAFDATVWGDPLDIAYLTDNVASATKLQTTRTIGISGSSGASGSVSFDGTGNALIPLSVITQPTATNNLTIATTAFVQAVNSADTGSAATALTLKTARLVGVTGSGASGSVSFDGSSNVNIPLVVATQPTTTNNTTIATTAFVQAVNSADTGSAATALTLKTARTINGTSFNGSANITTANWGTARNFTIGSTTRSVNGASNLSWTLTDIGALGVNDNAVSATKLQTPRKVNGVDFDGSANITIADNTKLPLSGGTITGSQTINGDLVVKQNVKVEGITTDRFGFYDKMYWSGAISRPNAQNVLVTPLDENRFTAYFTLNSGSQYINFGTSKIHMIQNWDSPTPKYIQATIDSSVDANAGKQVITLTCTLPNHGILAATNFFWIAITYESFGCEIDQYIANGDMRYVSRLKSDSAFSSKSPIVTISSSSSEWFSGTQSGTGSPEIRPTASSSAPIVAAVSGQHISFVGVGGIQVPYVTISVKDRII